MKYILQFIILLTLSCSSVSQNNYTMIDLKDMYLQIATNNKSNESNFNLMQKKALESDSEKSRMLRILPNVKLATEGIINTSSNLLESISGMASDQSESKNSLFLKVKKINSSAVKRKSLIEKVQEKWLQ